MGKIFFTSDWHFCHSRDFIYGPRGFSSQYEMNEEIIKRYNSVVDVDDDVYVLGDCMLEDNETGLKCIKQLKGRLHIICGNHDSETRKALYEDCWNVVEVCDSKFLRVGDYHFYLSHYPCLCDNLDSKKPLKKKMISICGHVHTKDKFHNFKDGLIYHVELDAHDCYPVAAEQIIQDIKEKLNED